MPRWTEEHWDAIIESQYKVVDTNSLEEYKPTNADRIRAMDDKELAEFLEKVISGKREVIGIKCGNEKCESWKCTECIQTWLQSEAE